MEADYLSCHLMLDILSELFMPPSAYRAVVAQKGAMVAQVSSGGSLVATPDCDTAVLGSNPAISPAYSGIALPCRLSSEGQQRRI
jgi:hypothetical protein